MPIQPMGKKVVCECRRATRGNPGKTCDECERREFFEWQWDKEGGGTTVVFNNNDRDVIFNPGFSVGTAAVRGSKPFEPGCHHYWEIEMSTEVYGTDMMIGIGTEKTDLRKYSHNFVSMLGIDEQSWGLSYCGERKHAGLSHQYSKPFGQNSIVGLHLDLWAGTLEFYIDRKPLGLAFDGLRDKVLYPIISSTAARSGMSLIFCRSYPHSLQLQAMLNLSQTLISPLDEENASIFKVLLIPPGMKLWMKNHYWWIVSCRDRERKREEELNNRAKCDKKSRKHKRFGFDRVRLVGANDDNEEDEDFEPYYREEFSESDDVEEGEEEGDQSTENDEGVMVPAEPANPNGNAQQQPSTSRRRRGHRPQQHQCTGTLPTGESCMRFLAATSSRAHFLGRVSPIFVGMPEGGFSILSGVAGSASTSGSAGSSSAGNPRPVTRSRSVPAQPTSVAATAVPGTSSGSTVSISKVPIVRQPSTSEEDEDSNGSAAHSARREPKRLKLRTSIEVNGDDDEKNANEKQEKGEDEEPKDGNANT